MAGTGPALLADGRRVFVKRRPGAPAGFFAAEAHGLRWLAAARAVPVPEVLAADADSITVELVPEGTPTREGAERFGRALAELHAAGAPGFGAPWPGFIGPLAMDNEPVESPTGHGGPAWATFYAERRVLPFLRAACDRGSLTIEGGSVVERALARLPELIGPSGAEPPSRLHGDLWSGNLLWGPGGTAWLIDPAAHGGHRETDLAMLALFGASHLDRIIAAYHERRPLAEGWKDRVGLHQLHPLLVHAVLFGPSYGEQAVATARRYLGR